MPARQRGQPADESVRTIGKQLSLQRSGDIRTRRAFASLGLGYDAAVIAKLGR